MAGTSEGEEKTFQRPACETKRVEGPRGSSVKIFTEKVKTVVSGTL